MEKFNLRSHQKKCRCCFQSFHRQQKHLKITEDIKANFFSVTQIELRSSDCYSDEICLMCVKELTNFVEFQNKIAERQLELYKKFPETEVKVEEEEIEIFQVNIKQEPEVYFSDDGFDNFIDVKAPLIKEAKKRSKKTKTFKKSESKKIIPEKLCTDCGNHYKRLDQHIRMYHGEKAKLICDFCGYSHIKRSRLQLHMILKHKPELGKKFNCHLCNFSTVYKMSLKIHMNVHDRKPPTLPCHHCGKMFVSKYVLASHIKIVHENPMKFFCHLCPKTYVSKSVLKLHIITNHTKKDIRDIICEVCGKGFVTTDQLRGHMRTMHVEGKISCEFQGCDKKFHKMSRLHRHMLSHVNVKNHNCDKCSAVFTHRTQLNKHNQAHHLGLRYRCQVPGCSIEYMKQYNYKVHLKKSHSNLGAEIFEKFMAQARTMKPN